MPLSDDGYQTYDFADYLKETKLLFQDPKSFGQQADVSDGSPFGKIAYMLALKLQDIDNRGQNTYDAGSSAYAVGTQLDRLCTIEGIQRRQAQYSEVTLNITGDPGYLIQGGDNDDATQFTTDAGDVFIARDDIQISDDGTASIVCHSLNPEEAANVDAHTIINQANPVDEIDTVDNPNAAVGGEDLETDFALRQRLHINQLQHASSTLHGIETALINTPGVFSVTPHENKNDYTDENGDPPHTMHFYVAGGTDDDIANTLATYKGAGTTMVGNRRMTIYKGKSSTEVAWDRGETVYLKCKVDITKSDGFSSEMVQQSIIDFTNNYKMGDTIIINKLFSSLYNLDGVSLVNSIQFSKDGTDYSSDFIKLDSFQLGRILAKDIEVNAHDN